MSSWFDRLFEKLDAALRRLQRHCPKCGGELHRRFTFLDKIGLYVPLPHTIHAKHECKDCHARFRSFRSLTDLFLELGWLSGLYVLAEFWPLALAGTITWLIISSLLKGSVSRGEADTLAAGIIVGIVWMLALVFGDLERGNYLMSHPAIMVPIMIFLLFGPVWVVLVLDRYTNFHLEEC